VYFSDSVLPFPGGYKITTATAAIDRAARKSVLAGVKLPAGGHPRLEIGPSTARMISVHAKTRP
jgi:hypothetical protein